MLLRILQMTHQTRYSGNMKHFSAILAPIALVRLLSGLGLFALSTAAISGAVSLDEAATPAHVTTALPDSTNIKSYRDLISRLESQSGAYGSELPENLLGLGQALQNEGRHKEAVKIFKQGTHLARINGGLYSAAQIPLIRGEITSLIALGNLIEADSRQGYMLKVQQRSLSGPDSLVQALMQQAQWQYSAYQLGIGQQQYSRLMNMWDLYRGALSEIASSEGETSVKLLPPLNGLLQTQYLISGYQAHPSSSGSEPENDFQARQSKNRFNAYRASSYQQGQAVIRYIYDIELTGTEEQFLPTAQALVKLGDWMLWNGDFEPAFKAYTEAITELVERDDAEQQIALFFGEPVALPAIDEISPLPPRVESDEANILLEFDVNSRGRVVKLARLDDNELSQGSVNRLMRNLRSTRFRPRFEDMKPADTENIVYAYRITP
jgi:tetratricopeptide (TPR) repeat protein